MDSRENPYSATAASMESVRTRGDSRKRPVALVLIAAPFLIALPLHYWLINYAGGWVVSTEVESEHRRAFLGMMCIPLILSIAVFCFFPAAILLWFDSFHPIVCGVAAIIFGILLIPAAGFLAIGISSYYRFS